MPATTPHEALAALDAEGAAYSLVFNNVTHGTTRMEYIEREVLAHSAKWVQLKTVAMRAHSHSGQGDNPILSGEFLSKRNEDRPTWYQWRNLPSFEIREH